MRNHLVAQAITAVPMVLPPGTGQLATIITWVSGIAGVVLIGTFIGAVVKTGTEALSHGQLVGGKAMIVVLACGVLLGATSAIFASLNISA